VEIIADLPERGSRWGRAATEDYSPPRRGDAEETKAKARLEDAEGPAEGVAEFEEPLAGARGSE
jgi:hypothetical protein